MWPIQTSPELIVVTVSVEYVRTSGFCCSRRARASSSCAVSVVFAE